MTETAAFAANGARNAHRFRPSRIGVIGMYQFEDQVFEFADGHALMRGHNGSGKSKILELTVPLLLHGDLRPEYLDPFGSTSRTMRWNLLGDSDQTSATGYCWIEFARRDETGTQHWVTGLLGARATQASSDVKSWFAVFGASQTAGADGSDGTFTGRRIGTDGFALLAGRTPLTRDRLRDAIGDAGEVIDASSRYRQKLNAALFGLSDDRYDGMFQLIKALRKPQLSKTLDPDELSERLSDALAEIERSDVARVSARLEELDRLRRDLEEMRSVEREVRAFASVYADYAWAAVRERTSRLTDTHETVTAAQAAVREAEQRLTDAVDAEQEISDVLDTIARKLAEAEGAHAQLLASPGVVAADQLARQQAQCDDAQARVRRLGAQLKRAREQAAEAQAAHARAQRDVTAHTEQVTRVAAELASLAGLAVIDGHDAAVEDLADRDLDAVAGTLADELAGRRVEAIDAQLRLAGACALAEDRVSDAREHTETLAAAVNDRQMAADGAERDVKTAQEGYAAAADGWLAALRALGVSIGDDHAEAAAEAIDVRRRELNDTLADLRHRAGRLADARRKLVARRDELQAGQPPTVTRAAWRTAQRDGRDGAPLYELVDFAADLQDAHHGGLEGALAAMGLLDAWVYPDGHVGDIDLDFDTAAAAPADGTDSRTLADALVPTAGTDAAATVTAATVQEILTGVAWSADATRSPHPVCVDSSGGFRCGPLRGRNPLKQAALIGAGARRAARQREMHTVDEQLQAVDEQAAGADAALRQARELLETLDAEARRAPGADACASAELALHAARREHIDATALLADARQRQARRDAELAQLRERQQLHAHQHRLPSRRDELHELRERCESYRRRVLELTGAEARRRDAQQRCAERSDDVDRARQNVGDLDAELRAAAETADRLSGALDAARGTQADDVEGLQARLSQLSDTVRRLRDEQRRQYDRRSANARAQERCRGALTAARDRLDVAVCDRDAALVDVQMLGDLGFFALALGDLAPDDHAQAADWPLERTLEIINAIPGDLRNTGKPMSALIDDVDRRCDQLRTAIGGAAGYQVARERDRHSQQLTVVRITHQGQLKRVGELLDWLTEEIELRRRTIDTEDRHIFTDFLVGGLAENLRERIGAADTLVGSVNEALAECRTASGMQIQLQWRPREQEDPALRTVIGLLHHDFSELDDEQRAALIDFLRRRIDDAREVNQQGATIDHIMRALDYRAWHEFRVFRIQHGNRELLTRKKHAQGSGGEKAIALHLPLFAAAAAQFDAAGPTAPRLIALDEAFAGIDDSNRAQLMALTERFDLDYLFTSYDMWGCYPEVSALSIYDLSRDEQTPGVMAMHFEWDGRAKALLGEAAASTDEP